MWRRGLLIAALILGLFLTTSPVRAAVAIDSLTVKAVLQTDGTVSVTQQLEFGGRSTLHWTVYSNVRQPTFVADGRPVPLSDIVIKKHDSTYLISSKTTAAQNWQISYSTTSGLIRHDDRDQFFFKVFQEPGVSVGTVVATFVLPRAVDQPTFTGNVYAIGGVLNANYSVDSGQIITFSADSATAEGLMTINASWPKSVLQLSFAQEARLTFSSLDIWPWLILGVSLPLATLIVLLALLRKQKRIDNLEIKNIIDHPPANLSPLVVGVLVNKKIFPEDIVALLVDFCRRGYLVIIKRNDDYFLGPRRLPDQYLEVWEKNILEKILSSSSARITDKDLLTINKQSLFSPEVRDAFEQVYQITTQKHYFAENPHLTRIRYKLIGLAFYFVGTLGLIWTAVTGATPYLIIPLAGTTILAWLILRLTTRLIQYTESGHQEHTKWLEFANYLSQGEPIDPKLLRNQTFESYLAYAIALRQTDAWSRRFDASSTIPIRPEWFITYQDMTTTKFAQELTEFTGKISAVIATMRGPLVS